MPTTWSILIDWDRNGNFTDVNDDITNRIVEAVWFLGQQAPYEHVADGAMLQLVLNNYDKRYSPEYTSSPLHGKVVPFRPVKVQSNDGTTTRTHWTGWIQTIQPAEGRYGERLVQIVASGPMQFLKATETRIELQQNKRTDEIISTLIQEVVFPPALSQAWALDRVGNSELGITTILADISAISDLEQGKLTLGLAADNWVSEGGLSNNIQNTFTVYQGIQDITAAEYGRFFFNREGKAIFWNRHHLLQGGSAAASFNDTMRDLAYAYGDVEQVKNEVIVICHPRTISSSTTDILWQLAEAVIRVEPGKTREIFVAYEDDKGKRVGARDVTVTGIEYLSGSATVTVEGKASGANLKIVNNGTTEAVISKAIIRGRKITDSGEMQAKATHSASIVDYGRRTLRMNLPSIDDLEEAQYIADFERDRRGLPKGMVRTITFLSHATRGGEQHTQQLQRTIGDRIQIQETQTAHTEDYYIIGEQHKLAEHGALWETTWYLEPIPEQFPWKLDTVGRAELGTNTYLSF